MPPRAPGSTRTGDDLAPGRSSRLLWGRDPPCTPSPGSLLAPADLCTDTLLLAPFQGRDWGARGQSCAKGALDLCLRFCKGQTCQGAAFNASDASQHGGACLETTAGGREQRDPGKSGRISAKSWCQAGEGNSGKVEQADITFGGSSDKGQNVGNERCVPCLPSY